MTEITVEWLREEGACDTAIRLFDATFGASATLTRENLHQAAAVGLSLNWLATFRLPISQIQDYWDAVAAAWHWLPPPYDADAMLTMSYRVNAAKADAIADLLGLP